jgi:CBS domain-containing protein
MLNSVAVKDYMAASLVTFKPDMDVLQAIHQLMENGISGAPVVDNLGNIVGILSEKDCLKVALEASYNEGYGGTVSDYMSPNVITIDADSSVLDVARMFLEAQYKRYPVVSDNRLVGQISRRDVLRAFETIRKA